MIMDEIKLSKWKQRFEQNVNSLQTEYDAFFQNTSLDDIYSINMDESDEWQLQVRDNIPNEIKSRLEQIFLASKPEDSI